MDFSLAWFLANGSYALFFGVLIVAGLGVPIPEDIVLVSAGVLSSTGDVKLVWATAVCFVGVLVGDLLIFSIARKLGPRMFERRPFCYIMPPSRRAKVERVFGNGGGWVIFTARHLAGLRAPIFATAAMHGMPMTRFLFWDFLGLLVSAPIVIGLGYIFSESIHHVWGEVQRVEKLVIAIAAVLIAVAALTWYLLHRRRTSKTRQQDLLGANSNGLISGDNPPSL